MSKLSSKANWGNPPWTIDFHPTHSPIPHQVDFAVVGGGFAGLSAACWLRRFSPEKSVVLFESGQIGSGSSGHTGGMALGETAAGDLPGLGDVLAGMSAGLKELSIDCDLTLPGAWEIARSGGGLESPISWTDSGELRAVKSVSGGTVDPGKLISGLGRVAERGGAMIVENCAVESVEFDNLLRLQVGGREVRAKRVLLATNAMSLEMTGLEDRAQSKFTLAIATEPLSDHQRKDLGLDSGRPFYTTDFPYLWGRLLPSGSVVFGSGLVHMDDWRELLALDINKGQASELLARLETRVRALHPVLNGMKFPHRWGGPILIADKMQPVFSTHPRSSQVIVLGAFSGHGVALSGYLGRWAAEAMCDRRELPQWNIGRAHQVL